jgi:hypothetical protein
MRCKIKKLKPHLERYLVKHSLVAKWQKVRFLLENDLSHPSLHFKKIALKSTVFYSFRLDKKYRGICIFAKDMIEIIIFTNHYDD